jgi:hypothetical protein
MNRVLALAFLVILLAGCQLPPEQVPLKPLVDNGPPQPYADLMTRARVQAAAANEAFYVNKWTDLEDAGKGLEITARHMSKATDVPARHRDKLAAEADDLNKEAVSLREAAKSEDARRTGESLQRINLMVRQLRPQD